MTSGVNFIKVRSLMLEKGLSQQDILEMLIDRGVFPDSTKNSAYVTLNFALSGKRCSKKYQELLDRVYSVLTES